MVRSLRVVVEVKYFDFEDCLLNGCILRAVSVASLTLVLAVWFALQ